MQHFADGESWLDVTETCLHCYAADRAEGTVYCADCLERFQEEMASEKAVNDEYCWTHESPNGGWTCEICRQEKAVSDTNKKAQQAKEQAAKTGKTVTKEVAPGLVYKIKVRRPQT